MWQDIQNNRFYRRFMLSLSLPLRNLLFLLLWFASYFFPSLVHLILQFFDCIENSMVGSLPKSSIYLLKHTVQIMASSI